MKPGDLILRWTWSEEARNKVRTPALVIHFDGHTVYWLAADSWGGSSGLSTAYVGDVELISACK